MPNKAADNPFNSLVGILQDFPGMLSKPLNVVILAGGRNLRMDGNPKCMTFINGKTIAHRQIEWVRRNLHRLHNLDAKRIAMVGGNKELIPFFEELGEGILCIEEETPLGDAGAIRLALDMCKNNYDTIIINGDTVFTFEFKPLYESFCESVLKNPKYLGCVVVQPFVSHLGVIQIHGLVGDRVVHIDSFQEKPVLGNYWTSCGIYILRPSVLRFVPQKGDFAKDVLARNFDNFVAYQIRDYEWCAVESKKDIDRAIQVLNNVKKQKGE